ncbi:hypothetical protein BaRGS_00012874 [Batillaria attramentaria]|uniref:Uncharacterized protein n=1 Tax=Batillaria attramentaria TaxID=370345 RepID=A0ABD0L8J8_9CAEN
MATEEDASDELGSTMEEQLLTAIKEGGESKWKILDRLKVVRLMDVLGRTSLQDLRTPSGIHVLNYAILNYNFVAARMLLKKGVSPSSADKNGRTALHAAATVDDAGILVDIMKEYDDVNVKDDWGVACRKLTRKTHVLKLLRDYDKERKPKLSVLDTKTPFTAEDLPCSIQLADESDEPAEKTTEEKDEECGVEDDDTVPRGSNSLLYYSTPAEDLGRKTLELKVEGEEAWGPVVQYRTLQSCSANLVFPLCDCIPWWYRSSKPVRGAGEKVGQGITVAKAEVSVTLDPAGSMLLMSRPLQQAVVLEPGKTEVTSVANENVKLQAPEDFSGKIEGNLHLEKSVPIKVDPSLKTAEDSEAAEKRIIASQSDYVKFVINGPCHGITADQLTMQLPVPTEYTGSTMVLYYRLDSRESTLSVSESEAEDDIEAGRPEKSVTQLPDTTTTDSRRRSSSSSSLDSASTFVSDSEADEDEGEAKLWIKKQDIDVQGNEGKVKVPVVPNKTVTAVEVKSSVSEDKVKRQIAKQYRKRRYKKVVFLVIARPWRGWRVCREILVLVTSPAHLPMEMKVHVRDGYIPVQLSGELLTPKHCTFRASIVGDLIIEDGTAEATIAYHHAIRTDQGDNHCRFVVRRQTDDVTEGGILIEKRRKKKKHRPLSVSPWKPLGQMRFDVTKPTNQIKPPEEEDETMPFTDPVLMSLAGQMTTSQAAKLGTRLELSDASVNSILFNPTYLSSTFKCFQILVAARELQDSMLNFGKKLVKALHSNKHLNKACSGLFQLLSDWDG